MERFRKQNTQQDARILSSQKSSTNSFLVITLSLFSCRVGKGGWPPLRLRRQGRWKERGGVKLPRPMGTDMHRHRCSTGYLKQKEEAGARDKGYVTVIHPARGKGSNSVGMEHAC